MDFKEIQDLIKLVNKSDIAELAIKDGDFKIKIRTKHFVSALNNTQQEMPQFYAPPMQMAAPTAQATNAAPKVVLDIEPVTETTSTAGLIEIKSPIVGTFYRSTSPDKPPFIKIGDEIAKGDVVCIVEAMKLFNEIETEFAGKVVKVMVEDASPVEYDQVLFLIEPA